MKKLGAVSTLTRGSIVPGFVEDLIMLVCGEMYPGPCGYALNLHRPFAPPKAVMAPAA
jgi:hypothetical protein